MAVDGNATRRSTTALGNLALASIAESERDPSLRNEDPIASRLLRLRDGRVGAARFKLLHPALRSATERILPGIYGFALARLKHMDLIVRQEASRGIESLVILGAGYDTRAYRMQQVLSGVRVLEVDHPATSRDKQGRLAKALRSIPQNVSFVELDLSRQDLAQALVAQGQRLSTPTLFLLSGVSMYLPEEAMLHLLRQVAAHSCERTSLLFDYIDAHVLTEPDRFYGKEWLSRAAKYGEEPRWGIGAGQAEQLLAAHGLRLASDLHAEELTARYLQGAGGSTAPRSFEFGAIAHAFSTG